MLGLCPLHTAVFSVPVFFTEIAREQGRVEEGRRGKEKNSLKANVGEFDVST